MTNIIAFKTPERAFKTDGMTRLISSFAQSRRSQSDVFWLKENAELLGIFAATGRDLDARALDVYAAFYADIEARMQFYPQYYRFLLSIALDLEALGMPGDKAAKLCAWVGDQGLAEAELSDLQRAEARRLLQRRGVAEPVGQGALGARLHRFMQRAETFSMPNKKAAYELTHIVFYLSDYGKYDPQLSAGALLSLEYTGLLAFLDQNMDLLSEVCTALRFAGQTPSDIWSQAVLRHHQGIRAIATTQPAQMDAYHEYFVTGWAAKVAGHDAFDAAIPEGQFEFQNPPMGPSVLMALSSCLADLGDARSADWGAMRGNALSYLDQTGHDILLDAEASTDKFEPFFDGFARAVLV